MFDAGLFDQWMEWTIMKEAGKYFSDLEKDSAPQTIEISLSLEHLQSSIYLLAIGFLLCLICFGIEHSYTILLMRLTIMTRVL